MKSYLIVLIFASLVGIAFGQTRNVLADSNGVVIQPTNFWSVDASNARTGLGLGTAATNPSTAFQPANATLTNLSTNNAVALTNLNATNLTGVVAITKGGTGATNAATVRTNIGLGSSWLTNTNSPFFVADETNIITGVTNTLIFSNGLTIGGAIENPVTVPETRNVDVYGSVVIKKSSGTNGTTETPHTITVEGGTSNAVVLSGSITSSNTVTISAEGIVFGSAAATTRTNLGLGADWLVSPESNSVTFKSLETVDGLTIGTNTNSAIYFEGTSAAVTRTNLGIGETNDVVFNTVYSGAFSVNGSAPLALYTNATVELSGGNGLKFHGSNSAVLAATTRTNLGLGAGITTNFSFVDATTNTNTITISNGIITGWTR